MNLGQRIRAARKEMKMTQTELAEMFNSERVDQSVISKWESGMRVPNTAEALLLEKVLKSRVTIQHVAEEVEARRA